MSQNKSVPKTKDTPVRSILKAISWRLLASTTTFLIVFVIFRRFSDKSLNEVLGTATFITGIEMVAKLVIYYLHERLWTWGKYWRRQAARKRYRNIQKIKKMKNE